MLSSKARLLSGICAIIVAVSIVGCAGKSSLDSSQTKTQTPSSPAQSKSELPPMRSRAESIPADVVKMTPQADVYPPQLHSDQYEAPIPIPGPINTIGAEDSPFILPDGKTFYFFFTPDVRIPVEKQIIDGATGIYVSQKKNDVWSEPERVILNDDISLDGCIYVQGNTMWFCSARAGYTGVHWFTAALVEGRWQNWQYASDNFDETYDIGELHFSADGSELYYHSARPGGKGNGDIWVTRKVNGKWQLPENIKAINTEENEAMPFLSRDGSELWFNRSYQGSPAVFRSKKVNGEWSEPELIVSWFAGEPSLDNQGNLYFVHHFFKDSKMIEADIYVAYRK